MKVDREMYICRRREWKGWQGRSIFCREPQSEITGELSNLKWTNFWLREKWPNSKDFHSPVNRTVELEYRLDRTEYIDPLNFGTGLDQNATEDRTRLNRFDWVGPLGLSFTMGLCFEPFKIKITMVKKLVKIKRTVAKKIIRHYEWICIYNIITIYKLLFH